MVAAAIRTIFAQPDAEHVREQLDVIAGMLGRQLPKVETMLHDAADDLLAFTAFPVSHWKKIWSTNPLERLNKGDQTPHRRRRCLPPPRSPAPAGRSRPRRGPRRVANRRPPLPRRRIHGPAHRAAALHRGERTCRGITRRVVSTTTNRKTEERTEPHAGDLHHAAGRDPASGRPSETKPAARRWWCHGRPGVGGSPPLPGGMRLAPRPRRRTSGNAPTCWASASGGLDPLPLASPRRRPFLWTV
jgi:Transposase, Mutator family